MFIGVGGGHVKVSSLPAPLPKPPFPKIAPFTPETTLLNYPKLKPEKYIKHVHCSSILRYCIPHIFLLSVSILLKLQKKVKKMNKAYFEVEDDDEAAVNNTSTVLSKKCGT